jgi:hypothetical protein
MITQSSTGNVKPHVVAVVVRSAGWGCLLIRILPLVTRAPGSLPGALASVRLSFRFAEYLSRFVVSPTYQHART